MLCLLGRHWIKFKLTEVKILLRLFNSQGNEDKSNLDLKSSFKSFRQVKTDDLV